MDIVGGWKQVKFSLEEKIDEVFSVDPEHVCDFDSVLTTEEMESLGYARNFPHLTCLMCSIDENQRTAVSSGHVPFSASTIEGKMRIALLPAACYKVYMNHKNSTFKQALRVSCIARCFRNEDKPLDNYRSLNFTMKEVVCLGSSEEVQQHLEIGMEKISRILDKLAVPFECEIATDPFFDASSSTAILSKLLPTKREIIFDGHAISSLNYHRTYFGEKFNIILDDEHINTSCVAFGIDRWVAMLKEVYREPQNALSAIQRIN